MQKEITCHDIKGNAHKVQARELKFRPGIYAVIVQNGKVLLSKQWDGYDFPGGGIELGETFEEALKREVWEETGLEVTMGQLVSCEESFFRTRTGESWQSYLIFFTAEITGGELSTKNFDEHEKDYADMPEWIDLTELDNIKFYNPVDSITIINKASLMQNQ